MQIDRLRRREFLTLLGGAAWPLAARAQPAMPVIGFLNRASRDQDQGRARAFLQGLGEAGYVEGSNVTIDYRWAGGQRDPLAALSADAADLVRRQVSVIVAGSDTAALAAKAATDRVPIVFGGGNDPVRLGLVASLSRPGGNITGVVNLNIELGPKRLELLHELVPSVGVIFLLVNPTNPSADTISRDLQAAARSVGLESRTLYAGPGHDLDAVFANLVEMRAGALVIGADVFLTTQSERLAALTIRNTLPAISQAREFAAAGGLASYGTDIRELNRLIGRYTGRILKGEKPADLPVQQATKVQLVINLKTAKTFGIAVPLPLSGRADELIE
jgi:putative ABC transport system substrate-binding protein